MEITRWLEIRVLLKESLRELIKGRR